MDLAALAIAAGLTAACGGGEQAPEPPPESPVQQARDLGRYAFEHQRYAEAARIFADGVRAAAARDDIAAIRDLGYEQALAELRAGNAAQAAGLVDDLRDELMRRDVAVPAELDLVAASARYALGELDAGERVARRARSNAETERVAGRAAYLLGMIAADRGDAAALDKAIDALASAEARALIADRQVLRGRRAMGRDKPRAAVDAFRAAADIRRSLDDKAGMADALSRAGEAARAAGRLAEAADLYYRAGRTAALIDRADDAVAWLQHALRAAERSGSGNLADAAQQRLQKVAKDKSGSAFTESAEP